MKKYKIYWSILNLTGQTQAEVVKLQQIAKALFGTVTIGTWATDSSTHALWVGLIGMVIDLAIGCICLEEIKICNNENNKNSSAGDVTGVNY